MSAPKKEASTKDLPPDEDRQAWLYMPFVDKNGKWEPAIVTSKPGSHSDYAAQWAIGYFYAASLIGYLRARKHVDCGYALPDLMRQIARKELDPIVRALLHGIGQYIAQGRIDFTLDFFVVPNEPAGPS